MLVIDPHDMALRHLYAPALFQHLDNLRPIIFARGDEASYTTPTQALLRDSTPALHALHHQATEKPVNECAVGLHCRHFLRRRAQRVSPGLANLAFKISNSIL